MRTARRLKDADVWAAEDVKSSSLSPAAARIIAAGLYWCEGEKARTASSVRFANADPRLVRTFLWALRRGFRLREQKFRAIIHAYPDLDEETVVAAWSSMTGIPRTQFHKTFWKKSGRASARKEPYGCISIRYQDVGLVRKLEALYHAFAKRIGAW